MQSSEYFRNGWCKSEKADLREYIQNFSGTFSLSTHIACYEYAGIACLKGNFVCWTTLGFLVRRPDL